MFLPSIFCKNEIGLNSDKSLFIKLHLFFNILNKAQEDSLKTLQLNYTQHYFHLCDLLINSFNLISLSYLSLVTHEGFKCVL